MKKHTCKICGKKHDLYYYQRTNGQEVLAYTCLTTKKFFMLPYVGFLDIPTRYRKKILQKQRAEKAKPELPIFLGVLSA
jgi:hypothetical protein